MVTAISQGVKISIETLFQEQYSNAAQEHFMFAYKISIENLTDYPIQLLSRKWFILEVDIARHVFGIESRIGGRLGCSHR